MTRTQYTIDTKRFYNTKMYLIKKANKSVVSLSQADEKVQSCLVNQNT